MKAIIFDLDGTLIDSVAAITAVGNALLSELSLPPMTVDEGRQYIGRGAPNFVKKALGGRGVTMKGEHIGRFKKIYADADGSGNPPFAGVEELLDRLAADRMPLGICTNKPEIPTLTVLRHLGWGERFASVIGGDTLDVRKPDPAPLLQCIDALGAKPAEIIYVGDSEVDAQTAEAARVTFALYTEGYRKSGVEDIPHDFAFSHHNELNEWLFN